MSLSYLVFRHYPDNASLQHSPFISAAERYGLMYQIDKWVITQLFSHYPQLAGRKKNTVYSINLSGESTGTEGTSDFINNVILRYKIPASSLCFESPAGRLHKIDDSFVRDMLDDDTARTIVEAINNLRHSVGLQTIAEFVETPD